MEDARNLLDEGNVDGATQIVDQALATQPLDAADPRVKTFLVEVEKKKQELTAVAPPVVESKPPQPEQAPATAVFSATNISAPPKNEPASAPPASSAMPSIPAAKTEGALAGSAPAKTKPVPSLATAPPASKKRFLFVAAIVAIAAVAGTTIYFSSNRASTPPAATVSGPAPTATSSSPQPGPTTASAPSQPSKTPPLPAKSSAPKPTPRERLSEARKAAISKPPIRKAEMSKTVAYKPAWPAAVKPRVNAYNQLHQLIREYNAETVDAAQLRKLQTQFRALENAGGSVGSQANLYAEQRIPADLMDLESETQSQTPPVAPSGQKGAAAPASASTKRYLWVVSVDSSSAGGVQPVSHPLPLPFVAQAAAQHSQFDLQLSIDPQGRISGGRVLAGDPALGRKLVNEAAQSWSFTAPGGNGATVRITVEF